jgi:anaerobic selenocysteine-containing dehydrogenase
VVRFANCFGTPNWYEPGLAECFHPRVTLSRLTYGGLRSATSAQPRTILFWGHNPLVSGPDGELSFPIERALANGDVFGIAVDPRRSQTARRCKLWLPIRPGADAALALAMMNVIIAERLYDEDFVADWCSGFDRLAAHVKGFTPDRASEVTGVARDEIVLAARTYATRKPGILEWGGLSRTRTRPAVRVALLRAITGNLDVPGGDLLGMDLLQSCPVHRVTSPPRASRAAGVPPHGAPGP